MKESSLRTKNKAEAAKRSANLAAIERLARADAVTQDAVARAVHGRKLTCDAALVIWQSWARVVGLAPTTTSQYTMQIGAFLRDLKLGAHPVNGITDAAINDWVNGDGLTASARGGRLRALRSFVEVLATKGFIPGNPAKGIRVRMHDLTFAQKEPRVREPFTDDEVSTMLAHLPPKWRFPVIVSLETGLRLVDVARLEWASIRDDNTLVVWTDKSDKRIAFPMTRRLANALLAVPRTHRQWVFPELQASASDPDKRSTLSTYFGRELKRCGIFGKSFHNLRHTFATRMKQHGSTIDEIREKLGHSLEETTKGYTH